MKSKTVVFIHGMYMTPLCWEHWIDYFEARGYTCVAPAWPGRDRPVEEIRRNPDPKLPQLTLSAVVAHMAGVIKGLPEPPILIGHSMGGLAAQILLQQGASAAAVGIDPAPPRGVLVVSWPFVKANWPHLNPLANKDQPVEMSFERFQYTFVNDLPLEEQRAAFDRYVVPESRRVPAQGLSSVAAVDWKKPRPPLLLIAGANDHLVPAAMVRSNYSKYSAPGSITNYQEFSGRTHFITGQKGWEEVAGYVAGWIERTG